jgi:hypothetical protein
MSKRRAVTAMVTALTPELGAAAPAPAAMTVQPIHQIQFACSRNAVGAYAPTAAGTVTNAQPRPGTAEIARCTERSGS